MHDAQPLIGPDDPECALLVAVLTLALRDFRRGPSSPHYWSAVVFLQALGVVNDRYELDPGQLIEGT